uniref:Secreted protein n=1 Tax=Steinernema glaseri TaxID=37863 RepID=A0A1I7YUY1_9BILA
MSFFAYFFTLLLLLFILVDSLVAEVYCYWTTCHPLNRPNSYRPGFEFRQLQLCDSLLYVREYYCKESD